MCTEVQRITIQHWQLCMFIFLVSLTFSDKIFKKQKPYKYVKSALDPIWRRAKRILITYRVGTSFFYVIISILFTNIPKTWIPDLIQSLSACMTLLIIVFLSSYWELDDLLVAFWFRWFKMWSINTYLNIANYTICYLTDYQRQMEFLKL